MIDLSDAVFLFSYLHTGGPVPACRESGDVNNDGAIDITDGIALLLFSFLDGAPPAGPAGAPCGPDPDADDAPVALGCESYEPC